MYKNKFCIWSALLLLLSLILAGSCNNTHKDASMQEVNDFDSIMSQGTLRVLTLYSSTSYFLYKGEQRGYEYELIKRFADDKGLKLDVKVADNITHLTQLLIDGKGDIIVYEMPVTGETKELMLHCGYETITHQVLVQTNKQPIKNVVELVGKDVYVERGSKYEERINNLNDELGGGIKIHCIDKDTIVTEDLIEMVSQGKIPYTLADENLARLNKTYYPNLNITLAVSFPQRSCWAVRKDSHCLANAINEWVENNNTKEKYKAISKRYFELSKRPSEVPILSQAEGRISQYDDIFKRIAKEIDWDWRMFASIAYHESRFDSSVVSWVGARGIMQLMPATAAAFGLSADSIAYNEPNVRAASRSIKSLERSFTNITDTLERTQFILAAYNAGIGHVLDAIALAKKYGKNPQKWKGEVEEAMLMKGNPEYFNDEVCRFGYFRGRQTAAYVRDVMNLYKYYCEKIPIK